MDAECRNFEVRRGYGKLVSGRVCVNKRFCAALEETKNERVEDAGFWRKKDPCIQGGISGMWGGR